MLSNSSPALILVVGIKRFTGTPKAIAASEGVTLFPYTCIAVSATFRITGPRILCLLKPNAGRIMVHAQQLYIYHLHFSTYFVGNISVSNSFFANRLLINSDIQDVEDFRNMYHYH